MTVTYVVVIVVITYILGAITKLKVEKIPNKYIPIQNVIIGVVSAIICWLLKIEPDPIQAFALCITSAIGAGGIADLTNKNNYNKTKTEVQEEQG